MGEPNPGDWAERVAAGDRMALARAMTWLEDGTAGGQAVLQALWSRVGRAERIGVTGPPGAGKSTLVNRLVQARRAGPEAVTVGVVAVDPTSPFSGGALLGDRVRMLDSAEDPGVFIRSMASRGHAGGLALAAQDVADLLDASGRGLVLLETVGVGQLEVDVASAADTTVVVLSPESGDGMQAMKAGLMEIADILVVNKADRDGADRLAGELEQALDLAQRPADGWRPLVVQTTATADGGVEPLTDALAARAAWLAEGDRRTARRAAGLATRIQLLVRRQAEQQRWAAGDARARLAAAAARVARGECTPAQAAAEFA